MRALEDNLIIEAQGDNLPVLLYNLYIFSNSHIFELYLYGFLHI